MTDTLLYFKKLEAAGFTRKQAEAQVELVTDFSNQTFATKVDLLQSEGALRKDLQAMEASVRKDMQALEAGIRKDMQASESAIRKDMQASEAAIRKDMQTVRDDIRDLRHDLESVQDRMTIRLGAMLIAGFGALAALIKLA